jgi:hypothetical protein
VPKPSTDKSAFKRAAASAEAPHGTIHSPDYLRGAKTGRYRKDRRLSNLDELIKRSLLPLLEEHRKALITARAAGATETELAEMTAEGLTRASGTFTDNPQMIAWLTEQFSAASKET